jgi:hypothetical protein
MRPFSNDEHLAACHFPLRPPAGLQLAGAPEEGA